LFVAGVTSRNNLRYSLQCRYMGSSSSLSAEDRARWIKLIIFDVDGVLTDGGIWLFPAPAPSASTANHAAEMESKGGYAISSTITNRETAPCR